MIVSKLLENLVHLVKQGHVRGGLHGKADLDPLVGGKAYTREGLHVYVGGVEAGGGG